MPRATQWIWFFAAAQSLWSVDALPPRLVEFPVVALDGKGRPMAGVREDELSLSVDGQPRDIASFRFEGGPDLPLPACTPGFFTNRSACKPGPPRNIVATCSEPSWQSLEALAEHLSSHSGRRSIVWTALPDIPEEQIRAAAERVGTIGISVYPVDGPHAALIASLTGGRVVESAAAGTAAANSDLQGAYTVGFLADGETPAGWHHIAIEARPPGIHLVYAQGYLYEPPVERDWTEAQWSAATSEPLNSATLGLDSRCEMVSGAEGGTLHCTLQIPDHNLGFLPDGDQLRGEVETELVEKMGDGHFQVQHARAPFHLSASLAESLETHATQITARWKIGPQVPLLRLIVRDRLSSRYATFDLPAEKIPAPGTASEETAPAALPPGADPFIEKARDLALTFLKSLPNYVVVANTTRERQGGVTNSWEIKDRIVAEVVYDAGKETTRDATLNGQPATVRMLEDTGTWATGQFAGTLRALYDRESRAVFRARGTAKLKGRETRVYDYSIERANSGWMLSAGDQRYVAAYHGTIWLDPETAQTLRFEMKARGLPGEFPFNRAESTTEFGMVHIGSMPYLMPQDSVALICSRVKPVLSAMRRGSPVETSRCARNVIHFTGYRQFGVESNITFGPGH